MSTRQHTHSEAFAVSSERLFEILYTPSAICAWWGAAQAIVLPEAGGLWVATWGEDVDAPEYICAATISVFDAPRRLVLGNYKYWAKTGPLPFEADFVTEFSVSDSDTPDGRQGAQLRVEQNGFPAHPSADAYFEACAQGWTDTFAGIRKYLTS
ncbi:MAG: SRPBCC domain-containing protein [Planctomycetota bacterium]